MPASTTALRPSASVSASNPAAAARKAVARAYQHGTEVPGLHYFYLNSRRQWIQIPPKGLTAGAVYQIQARVGKDVLAQFGYNWGSSYRHSFQGRTKSAVTTLTIAFSPQTRVLGQPVRSTSSAITRKADPGYFYTTTRELLRLAGLYPNHRYQFRSPSSVDEEDRLNPHHP